VICKVAAHLRRFCISGFYTEEIREFGERRGFRLVTFNNEQAVISHVDFDHRYRVGKYGVDVTAIDHFANLKLIPTVDIDVFLIDEIGKMECLSQRFVDRVQQLLESKNIVVATAALKGDGFIESVKRWPGSELWEITNANRDKMPLRVVDWFQKRLGELSL